ncbi:MAG: hypothetical protein JWM59_3698 [Verrucomicrobiales bacterium]|nr:hypothetical protein [Verrucomicrobiales bacterium]
MKRTSSRKIFSYKICLIFTMALGRAFIKDFRTGTGYRPADVCGMSHPAGPRRRFIEKGTPFSRSTHRP